MAKFVFKLQVLLTLKQQMEDNLKNELGKAIRKLEAEETRLRSLENQREETIIQLTARTGNGIIIEKLKEYNSFLVFLNEKIIFQKENVNFAKHNVDKVREQLIHVIQEKEMLEKLKEKKYENFMKEQLKLEQKLADEVISFKQSGKVNN